MPTASQTRHIKLPQDWHTADIKAALEKAGWSLRKLAFHHGFKNGSTLNVALRKPYPNAEKIIASAIGVTPEEIWPSRYDHRRPLRGVGGAHCHIRQHTANSTASGIPINVSDAGGR